MTDPTDEKEHTQTFSGYLAELIRLQAERIGKTPQAYVLSFFETRCNAPSVAPIALKARKANNVIFHRRGAMHPAREGA